MERRLLTTKEVAEILRTSSGQIANLRMRGEGPPYLKFSRRVLYDVDDLNHWLEKRRMRTVD